MSVDGTQFLASDVESNFIVPSYTQTMNISCANGAKISISAKANVSVVFYYIGRRSTNSISQNINFWGGMDRVVSTSLSASYVSVRVSGWGIWSVGRPSCR